MKSSMHIMIVDDHGEIRSLLAQYLKAHGFRTTCVGDGQALRRALPVSAPDLILLDIMMPGEDGLSLCRWVRESRQIPVILLTAMDEQTDKIIGLEIGADDYITKPFSPREILARIRSVLRRSGGMPVEPVQDQNGRKYTFGPCDGGQRPWLFDARTQELSRNQGMVVPLSTLEKRLLGAFVRNPGVVLSRDQILDMTRGREAIPFDRAVDNAIARLRHKLDDSRQSIIITHRGKGYAFTEDVTVL